MAKTLTFVLVGVSRQQLETDLIKESQKLKQHLCEDCVTAAESERLAKIRDTKARQALLEELQARGIPQFEIHDPRTYSLFKGTITRVSLCRAHRDALVAEQQLVLNTPELRRAYGYRA